MSKNPWFKFYPQDWRGDAKLRMCSLGARGLWIELCSVMHEAEPYGHLIVNGQPVNDTQLALLVGGPSDQITGYLGELESAGVFSRNVEGVIYSRRMTRDYKRANVAKKNGRKGGNPTLGKQTTILLPDNPQDKGQDKPQNPETKLPEYPPLPPQGGGALRLKGETYELARRCAQGLDIYWIEQEWRGWLADKPPPRNPDAAFIAFARKFAERRKGVA